MEKLTFLNKCALAIDFLRDIHEKNLSIEGADNKQSKFANELKDFDKGIKGLEKKVIFK